MDSAEGCGKAMSMSKVDVTEIISKLKFDAQGLIPAIVQDSSSGKVLTLAFMNREALELSLQHLETYFWSRTENFGTKETSGNTQKIIRRPDRDGMLIFSVEPQAQPAIPAESCFTINSLRRNQM
jgi:phosphoribosyl-ATP pyrophosphohydrolase/phosphoribosyl-AMP cyclohydrolase